MPSFIKPPLQNPIEIGARSSPLSRVQVTEVLDAMFIHHPTLQFNINYFTTVGDRDQLTSLRTLERTDFFTRDIDLWVLEKRGRVGIHSAKDLPHPLPHNLRLFSLTPGINPSDSLVLKNGLSLTTLPIGARIATSSVRRESAVQELRSDLTFCDIRGTIEQRLSKLMTGEVDGVVIAEAALIRLKLTHLNRVQLPGPTVEGQGKLAVVGHIADTELQHYFSCLSSGKH